MAESSVLDTSVLIGLSIELDQHHKTCYQHVVDCDGDCWVTPTAREEYNDIAPDIRDTLNDEIISHRQRVQSEVDGELLGRGELKWIRENLIADSPRESKSYTFLYSWYDDLIASRPQIHRRELIDRLSDMEHEPFQDAAEEYGGWRSLVSFWYRGGNRYPSIEADLLPEGNDLKICMEGHHIAVSEGGTVNLATADGDHCGKKSSEPESRKENIERVTEFGNVVDLRHPKKPV